jgi:hypothetical protein
MVDVRPGTGQALTRSRRASTMAPIAIIAPLSATSAPMVAQSGSAAGTGGTLVQQ